MNATRVAARWMRSPRWRALAAALGVAALAGCTDARVVDQWRDPDYQGPPMRSLLVVSQQKDPVTRRLWEDAICAELSRDGLQAVPEYTLFPDGVPSQQRMAEATHQRDLDGALTLRALPTEVATHWVPGYRTLEPVEYYNPWSGRGRVLYVDRWHHGYRVADRYTREQITLWTGADQGRMVWAATVEVANPSSPEDLRHELASGLVPGMKRVGLISV